MKSASFYARQRSFRRLKIHQTLAGEKMIKMIKLMALPCTLLRRLELNHKLVADRIHVAGRHNYFYIKYGIIASDYKKDILIYFRKSRKIKNMTIA